MCGRVCLSARLRSYVTETVAQTMLGTFKFSPFTCLSVSNLQQMRTESAHCLQFIFRSCHLFVESSGCVWGDWKRRPFHMHSKLQTWIWIIILTWSLFIFVVAISPAALCLRTDSLRNTDQHFQIWTLPPPNLLATAAPRHPFHTNLPRTHVPHAYSYTKHVTPICVTMPASAHTKLDTFIHKLIRGVDLPAAIHQAVTQPRLGAVWHQRCRREVPGI